MKLKSFKEKEFNIINESFNNNSDPIIILKDNIKISKKYVIRSLSEIKSKDDLNEYNTIIRKKKEDSPIIDLLTTTNDLTIIKTEKIKEKVIVNNGKDGLSAYECYLKNNPDSILSESEWLESLIGSKGLDGESLIGLEGKSAYQIAIENGFVGSELEWLNYLKGDTGTGLNGLQGEQGIIGESAYQLAIKLNEFQGTEREWIASLKGEKGDKGDFIIGEQGPKGESIYDIAVKHGFKGNKLEFLESLKGKQGIQGLQGIPGISIKGESGLSAYELYLKNNPNNNLSEEDWLQSLIGKTGDVGRDGINGLSAYELYIKNNPESKLSEIEYLESLIGKNGKDGESIVGKDGLSAYKIYLKTNPIYPLSESDWLLSLKGEAGDKGDSGLSAYEIYLKLNSHLNSPLSESEWLLSLKGDKGDSIQGERGLNNFELARSRGFVGDEDEYLKSLIGPSGKDGSIPKHEYGKGQLRFQNPDGEWGEWINLKKLIDKLNPQPIVPQQPTIMSGGGSTLDFIYKNNLIFDPRYLVIDDNTLTLTQGVDNRWILTSKPSNETYFYTETFTITDPNVYQYDLYYTPIPESEHVHLNRLFQYQVNEYNIINNKLVMLAALKVGDVITIKYATRNMVDVIYYLYDELGNPIISEFGYMDVTP